MLNERRMKHMRGDYPHIGTLDKAIIPSDVVFGGRHRIEDSYSDYKYHLHLYQARYAPKKIYKRLKYAEARISKYDSVNPNYATGSDKHTIRNGPEIEPFEMFFSPFYFIIKQWRAFVTYWTKAFFSEYFYSAAMLYTFLWTYFYFVEYVVICLQLYFPIVNWLFYNPIFIWPIANDFYFSHFLFVCYFPALTIFFVSQYANKIRGSGFANNEGSSHFFVIILVTYLFSVIFFFYFLGFSVIFNMLIFYASLSLTFLVFLYKPFSPGQSNSQAANPVLFLPIPSSRVQIFLPKYRYLYPNFSCISETKMDSIRKTAKKNFTKFPFISRSGLRGLSKFYSALSALAKIKLVSSLHSKQRPLAVYPSTVYPAFPNAYSFDQEAFYNYIYMPKFGTHETFVEDEDSYVTRYIDPPAGLSTNHHTSVIAVRARAYAESIFDNTPHSSFQYLDERTYLRNWLIYVAPTVIPDETIYRFRLLRDSYFQGTSAPRTKFNRFPILAYFLGAYDYFLIVLDFITGYRYYNHPKGLLGNRSLVNQLRVFNYILCHTFYIREEFVEDYASFLYYFYDTFDWDTVNGTYGFVYIYKDVCSLLDSNYKIVAATGKSENQNFVFISFVLLYQIAGAYKDLYEVLEDKYNFCHH